MDLRSDTVNAQLLLAVAAGGAIGSVGRLLAASAFGHALGTAWPWGTLVVNVAGGFAIGLLAGLMAVHWSASPELRGFLITGLLGGFTTFSAFSLEVMMLIERNAWGSAATYVVASVALSLAAAFAGLWIARGVA
jgi:fluoride exporter